MRITLFIVIICLLTTSCHHSKPTVNRSADSTKTDTATASQKLAKSFPDIKMVGDTNKQEDITNFDRPWIDSLITDYIKHTKNELVISALQNKIEESWMFDQIVTTDTAIYARCEVGHDVTDKGGSNPRYTADSWIYIDTVKRILYEDNGNGQLTKWKK